MSDLAKATRISPGSKVDLGDHDPGERLGLGDEGSARDRTANGHHEDAIELQVELRLVAEEAHRRLVRRAAFRLPERGCCPRSVI